MKKLKQIGWVLLLVVSILTPPTLIGLFCVHMVNSAHNEAEQVGNPSPSEKVGNEKFAEVYDGAKEERMQLYVDLQDPVPEWLRVSAYLYDGKWEHELSSPMMDSITVNDIDLWNQSTIVIEFFFSLNDDYFMETRELEDSEIPRSCYTMIEISDWAFDETIDGRIHSELSESARVTWMDVCGEVWSEEYFFDPTITIVGEEDD